MTVSPQLPLEIVMQMFKRMGCVPCREYVDWLIGVRYQAPGDLR